MFTPDFDFLSTSRSRDVSHGWIESSIDIPSVVRPNGISHEKEDIMASETLEDLLIETLRDTYNAEKQLVKALPKMAKAASSDELRAAFEDHLEVTREQVTRLEKVFKELGVPVRGKHCVAMEGLIEEGRELMEEDHDPEIMDAGLIAAAQKVEHYEIAAYGTVRTWAEMLGHRRAAQLLRESLDEESETDEKLTQLAMTTVNLEAEEGTEEE
jgi:ferritin-like metal-binding protein YciE